MLFEKELAKNVTLHLITLKQFKSVTLQAIMMMPIENSSPEMFILSFLLDDVCKKYKTKDEVTQQLDDLYGASFEICEKVRGNADMMEFTLSCIDGNYVYEPNLLLKQIDLFFEFVLNPLVEQEQFKESVFLEAQEKAITATKLVMDDESSYVFEKTNQLYGGDFSKRCIFSEKQLKDVENKNVYQAYQYMLDNAMIDFFMIGNLDPNTTISYFEDKYCWHDRNASYSLYTKRHRDTYQLLEEEKSVSVSGVALLFETNLLYTDPLMPAMMIGNGMLGALPTSVLFQKIREEYGLCYTIESEHLVEDGLLRIYFESDKEEIDGIVDEIRQIVHQFKCGKIDDELLAMTKESYKNSWKNSKDHQLSYIQNEYVNHILKQDDIVSYMLDAFDRVDKEMVSKAFQQLELKTEFRLLKKEDENEIL